MKPTQEGFLAWVRAFMGINSAALPDDSEFVTYAYTVALETTNLWLDLASSTIYTYAIYNLGGDTLVNVAQDQPGNTTFKDLRAKYSIFSFQPGVITSSGDEGTSASYLNPEWMSGLTLMDLQNLKTPWGRQYLAWAQQSGTLWGLT